MNARQTHAVVAAGLRDPALLDRWIAEPETLAALGMTPGSLDLATLRKFAGLTTLVRHNALREDLPRTFRLLSAAGLEIALFADYAAHLAGTARRLASSPALRAADLAAFVARWIDPDVVLHRRLHDLIRHEATLAMLAEADLPPHLPHESVAAAPDSVAGLVGRLVLHAFASDPRLVVSTEDAPVLLGYWRAGQDAPLHIVELDILGFELLGAIDGCRSARQLSLGLTSLPASPAFLAALDAMAALGMIRMCAR